MSTNLYWEPVRESPGKAVGDVALKAALRNRHTYPVDEVLGLGTEQAFLEGLAAAGVEGAQELLDAIVKYGAVRVVER